MPGEREKLSEFPGGQVGNLRSKGRYEYQVYGIRFVVTYQDCLNASRTGFDDPKLGDDRRETVAAVLRYVGKHLAEVGRCDILFEASRTDKITDIGEAKPEFWVPDESSEYAFERLPEPPNNPYPPIGNWEDPHYPPIGNSEDPSIKQSKVFHSPLALEHLRLKWKETPIEEEDKPWGKTPDMKITINFGWEWHYLEEGIDSEEIDFFTVLLRYITQGLGVYSLSNATGGSVLGGKPPVFSSYDWLLRTDEGWPLWQEPRKDEEDEEAEDWEYGNFLRKPAILVGGHGGLFFGGEKARKKLGSYPRVYTGEIFLAGQSLSTFDPSVAKVVLPKFKRGRKRRTYAPFEVAALGDLGYRLAGPLKGLIITVENPFIAPQTAPQIAPRPDVSAPLPPTKKNKRGTPREGPLDRDYSVFAHHPVILAGHVAGNPTKWEWEISYDMNPDVEPDKRNDKWETTFVFPRAGEFPISLKVSNSQSSARDSIKLNVLEIEARVEVSDPPLYAYHPVTFSVPPVEGTKPVSYDWDFGDDVKVNGQTTANIIHAFATTETTTYRVKATISYSNENSDARETTDEIPVEIKPTGLRFDCSPEPVAHQPATFTAQVNDGVPIPRWYEWNFGDGSAVIRTAPSATTSSVVHAFNNTVDSPTTYLVSLKAIYDDKCPGAEETTSSLVVVAAPAKIGIKTPDSLHRFEWAPFTATSEGNPIDWEWYLDGASKPFQTGKAVESLVFTTTGTHTVKARIFYSKDSSGDDEVTTTVEVLPTALRIESDPATPTAGTTFTLQGSAACEKDVIAWRWYFLDFPNPAPDRFEQNPDDVRFDSPGEYKIRLKAIYQLNPEWSDTTETLVTVGKVKPAGEAVLPAATP